MGEPCHNGLEEGTDGDEFEGSWSSTQSSKAESQLISLLTTHQK